MPFPAATTLPSATTLPGIPVPAADPLLVEFTGAAAPFEVDDTAVPLEAAGGVLIEMVEV